MLPGGGTGSVAPQQSAAERKAERDAQRVEAAERRAERDKRRAAIEARNKAEQNLISDVARKPPTGRSSKGQLMDRLDEIWGASIVDWDIYENRARLLYVTRPSNKQGHIEGASRHYYVVEFDRNDNIVQRAVTESALARTVTAGLIRGRDEIILQWHEGRAEGGKPVQSTLERWSISNAAMLSSSAAPKLNGPRGVLRSGNHFQLVTAHGDLLYVATVSLESGPAPKTGVSWMLASPDGEVRDQALIVHDNEKVSTSDWFHSGNGGAGLILDLIGVGDAGISSQLKPETYRFGSASIRPTIFSERRLHVVGGTETGPGLPAFERNFMWVGLENVEQSVMTSGESTRLMNEAEGKYRVRDSSVKLSVAGRNRTVVAPSGGSHAVLVTNNHRDDEFPPTRGLWLQEYAAAGPRRDTYLNPDAEHLKTRFTLLADDGGGNLYVAGLKRVVRLNRQRKLSAYAESGATTAIAKAMVAAGDSVWIFGENSGEPQQQVWVERIQF